MYRLSDYHFSLPDPRFVPAWPMNLIMHYCFGFGLSELCFELIAYFCYVFFVLEVEIEKEKTRKANLFRRIQRLCDVFFSSFAATKSEKTKIMLKKESFETNNKLKIIMKKVAIFKFLSVHKTYIHFFFSISFHLIWFFFQLLLPGFVKPNTKTLRRFFSFCSFFKKPTNWIDNFIKNFFVSNRKTIRLFRFALFLCDLLFLLNHCLH